MATKNKTSKSAAKRFKLTGSGKLKRQHSMKSHILTKKSTTRKRDLRKSDLVDHSDENRIKRMLKLK